MDIVVRNGTVIDPVSLEEKKADVAVKDGVFAFVGRGAPKGTRELDASGLLVLPGLIDTHMHFEHRVGDPYTVLRSLLLQGVTTAIGGHCGEGVMMEVYKDWFSQNPVLNMGFMIGATTLREAVGAEDRYSPASPEQVGLMETLLEENLHEGALGLSFGLEYAPGTSRDELFRLAKVVSRFRHRFISIHIRYDGRRSPEAVAEAIEISRRSGVRVQVSHLGSMTAFGHSREALGMIEQARREGLDVTFDVYPYYAFAARIGSAVFDPGFEQRLGKGLESLEVSTGRFRGIPLTPELFARAREEDPDAYVIAHVMNPEEVDLCLLHPESAIASDAVLRGDEGHPRAAGTFPRGIGILRKAGLSWPEAVRHATSRPAEMIWHRGGRIAEGAGAELVVIDPDSYEDRGRFGAPLAAPGGVKWVVLNGVVVVEEGGIVGPPSGRILLGE
ncbi:MAG: amidohydrolase family protein [Thermovirgaceae bacterium]|nr:amidohydrolase family protein [Synergistales bacterium]HPC75912.1 amidohydrolase family protein [Synergistales bacterium]HRS48701.1 amidohydrolase family protein [Thermovirgaceae bacterium]HRU91073.1 amidohydrolase family protein [Thermovirgaceae bacterium]